jgi:uncharacterized phage protein (TIGR02218 family)
MKTLPAALSAMLATGTTTLCRCWRVERVDGVVFGFTDHDRTLQFNGVSYQPQSGFTASAIEQSLGLAVDTMEVGGALHSDEITEDDIALGRWDGADVEIWIVDWSNVLNRVIQRKGNFGELTRGNLAFQAEIRGLAHFLNQETGRTYARACDAILGDGRCKIDLDLPQWKGTGAVLAVASNNKTLTVAGLEGFAADWFAQGVLTWTSGANQGVGGELRSHLSAKVDLWQRAAVPIQVGDTFTVTAGCNKTIGDCRAKFANAINFRGFPHIPGNDFGMSVVKRENQNDGGSFFK